jgi:RimJ/RimL family protein N-acetyltransferase
VPENKLRLETTRLILRPFESRDIAAFSAYRSDENIARYQGWDAPYSLEQAEKFVEEMQAVTPGELGQWFQLALELKNNTVLIGDVAFKVLKNNRLTAEIGMTLAADYHNQGFGVEAVTEMVRYLFEDLEMHRVIANCDPQNHTAYRLLEKVGLRREGDFVESLWYKGYWASEYWYAILDREWRAKHL